MTSISSEIRNYFKLDLLIARSRVSLRRLFKNRYLLFNNGQVWGDSSICGNNYLTNVIPKNKKISLTPIQKTSLSNGKSDEWDVTTLINLLLFTDRPKTLSTSEIQQLDQEDKLLQQLKEIRNKLAHNATKTVADAEFNQLWTDLAAILIAFGDVGIELDKLKDDSVFDLPKQPINEENVEEALRLNSLGTQAHKDGKYLEAIKFFTKAAALPSVSNHVRAIFYSNMAGSRLSLREQQETSFIKFEFIDIEDERYLALQDAKKARNLWSTWWKGHFRVGKAYAFLDEHEKAIDSFQRAFALDPTKNEVDKALDESRTVLSRQSSVEYLDPRLNTQTIPEIWHEIQQNFGTLPETTRQRLSLIETIYPSAADVLKGYKYALGDIDGRQDYKQAAEYFTKAANRDNAEGMYNLAKLTDHGLGVEKDHTSALKLFEKAAEQPPDHPISKDSRNVGVAEAEYALGVRYFEGISVRKDLTMAAYWYQRAIDNGSDAAANKLGSMYFDGLAVNKNLEKAEQLLDLAARRGNPIAMLTLAELRLGKNDFQMAKIWHDRACESGNIVAQNNRDEFAKTLEARQQHSWIELEAIETVNNYFNALQIKISPSVASEHRYMEDYNMLKEYASRGSITAKQLCAALDHFAKVLSILIHYENLTEEQENMFVHELSRCYRIETIVAQIPCPMHKRVCEIIKRVLDRCTKESNSIVSQLDEDVRFCYATLNINSYGLIDEFVGLCKQKYPRSIYFFLVSGVVNGFRRQPGDGLYNINNALLMEPDNYELLYHKAVLLRHLGVDMNEAINAYQTFLRVAPKDHRKVPEVYYEMVVCYLQIFMADIASHAPTTEAEFAEGPTLILKQQLDRKRNVAINSAKKLYEEGKQAEKSQLPCFLPYKSENIAHAEFMIHGIESLPNLVPAPVNTRD